MWHVRLFYIMRRWGIQCRTSWRWPRCLPLLLGRWFGTYHNWRPCLRCHERRCRRWTEHPAFRETFPRLLSRREIFQRWSSPCPYFRSTRCRLHAHIGRRRRWSLQTPIQPVHRAQHPRRRCKYSPNSDTFMLFSLSDCQCVARACVEVMCIVCWVLFSCELSYCVHVHFKITK